MSIFLHKKTAFEYRFIDVQTLSFFCVRVGELSVFVFPSSQPNFPFSFFQNGFFVFRIIKLLKNNTLTTIIKLPENLFFGVGVTTSIFVFEAGKPQNGRNIIGYYIEEDGLETVKNQGRQDTKNRWQEKEDYWIEAIRDGADPLYDTRQIIDPLKHLSYQMPTAPFEIFEEDFVKTMMDYEMFQRGIDSKEFCEKLLKKVLYSSLIEDTGQHINISINKDNK
nr:MAG TPA: N-6 DNA Methylase [Caudoviricetes sp.]